MRIKDVREVEASAKGLVVVGKIAKIFDGKRIQGTKNGKDYDFVATSIKLEDDTGSIYTQFTDVDEDFLDLEGKTISCISCSINEYVDKQGVTQRSLRASSYSAEVVPETSQPELPEVQIEDPAHPVLPKTVPIKEESPVVNKPAEIAKPQVYKLTPREQEEREYWIAKDTKTARFIAKQHETSDAVALVVKFYKGTLEEALAKVILISNELVANIYQGLDYPIKPETEEKQTNLLKGIKTDSNENAKDYELDSLDVKALECKKQLHELTNDDIEYGTILGKFEVSQPYELKDKEQKAELVTQLANAVIELKKGK